MDNKIILTIGRQFGSGGRDEELAKSPDVQKAYLGG